MNHYMNLNIPTANQETSLYLVPFLYILAPMVVGTLLDIYINKYIGPQHCSFDEGEKNCTINSISFKTWQRELLRFLIQIVIGFGVFILLQKFISKQIYLDLSLILFFLCQTYLFDDFRRLIANILFDLTYGED